MLHSSGREILIIFLVFFIRTAVFSQGNTGGTLMTTINIEAGSFVTFKATSENGNSYQWFKNGQSINGATGINLKVSEPGIYTVLALNTADCSSIVSDPFKVTYYNEANLSILKKSDNNITPVNTPYEYMIKVTNKGPGRATNIVVNDVLPDGLVWKGASIYDAGTVNYNAESNAITWKMDSLATNNSSEIRFTTESVNPGEISNTATVSASETDTDLSDNSSTDKKTITDLSIPNVFTPNGDGVNDHFEIRNLNIYKENKISIINRWGNAVFEMKNYNNLWDGNGLDEGTYFYVLEVKNATGKGKAFKGYITLLRKTTTATK
ncbi:MAG TPA: gliding motility-associated C-terminal domain-containing protein [Pedobacter sp.]|jgi:gliding motility-associated-like protein/uncharacterized repeat protein (TIGR01451 family)